MKIIHCADLHLDSKINIGCLEKAKTMREEVFHAFERLCEYAVKNQVKVIIIAGDMFDTAKVSVKSQNRLLQLLDKYCDIDFVYLNGNHDELNFFKSQNNLPSNFKMFSSQWEYLRYGNVVIAGINLNNNNSLAFYSSLQLNRDDTNIVVLHGQVADYKSKENAEIISIPSFKDKNIDYLALGHIHAYGEGKIDERGKYVYCGCLSGRGFDELGEKGFVLLDIENNKVNSTFIPFAERCLFEYSFSVESFDSWYKAKFQLLLELKEKFSPKSLVKVILFGKHNADFEIDKTELLLRLNEAFFFAKVYDQTELQINIEDYKKDKSIRGEFVRTVYESDLPEDKKSKVIMCGLSALKEGV